MKIVTFKRLLGAAALYGAVRYIKAHGGPKAAFDDLRAKARGLFARAKSTASEIAEDMKTNTGKNGMASESSRRSSYASYDLDSDDKIRH